METANNIREFQALINRVRETKQPVKVRVNFVPNEDDDLDMEGIDTISYDDHQEIIPLQS